jgi:hypothetical protein
MSIPSIVRKLTRGLRAGEDRLIRHRPDFECLPVGNPLKKTLFAHDYLGVPIERQHVRNKMFSRHPFPKLCFDVAKSP